MPCGGACFFLAALCCAAWRAVKSDSLKFIPDSAGAGAIMGLWIAIGYITMPTTSSFQLASEMEPLVIQANVSCRSSASSTFYYTAGNKGFGSLKFVPASEVERAGVCLCIASASHYTIGRIVDGTVGGYSALCLIVRLIPG
ncbi:hypothetical protein E2C01_067712 [Portunus trituberculatus]|uniref:Uncharacterized protein n=1 Tax=Portunus trituberculatus TaxID=210409 RepID=A0A5B7HUC8_PORTR|nr:hypothetical protein [Portunus trituberculatus]